MNHRPRRRPVLGLLAGLLLTSCVAGEESADSSAKDGGDTVRVRLDWAYYNPESLVLKEKGWLEEALAAKGAEVTWTQSLGSNKANEHLRADVVDFGSTAGTPALLARANGTPLRTVYVYSQPEWSSLVVTKDSPIASVADLKGRRIAATKGTDPYFFLLQALRTAKLDARDVTVVNLQHAEGRTALERGQVDAWAGLDPYLSQSQIDSGTRLVYRNPGFNSYGVLNVREEFLKEHEGLAQVVVDQYERARRWILANEEEMRAILSRTAGITPAVAERQLSERTRFDIDPVPGRDQARVLGRVVPFLVTDGLVTSEKSARDALRTLFAPHLAERASR
ncbi:aliphatic sulfonate ABC transporter substrate-binding protein [Streptomyces sp. NPDC005805]|uniref:aliphatic sulfonate ABC transporter substrate-binding protein n=1 Tax=Streptomyces sp. NPDC005805 TaxID=3157068 RepID=UPI0033DD4EF0